MIEKLLHILLINSSIAVILFAWIVAIYGYGFMLLTLLQKRFSSLSSLNTESTKALPLLLALLLGLFFLCFIVAIWHIFLPLFSLVSIVVLLGGVIVFILYNRIYLDRNVITLLSAFFAFAIIVPLSVMSDSMGDSVNYHIQITTWIQESPLVFGLGNVHSRLGYNGLIYYFYALTDVSQIIPNLRSFIGNEIIFFGLFFSAFVLFLSFLKNRISLKLYEAFMLFSIFPFLFILKWGEFRGLYCEGIGAVMGVGIFALLLFIFYKNDESHNEKALFALAFFCALFATMIKIANFALILAVIVCFIIMYKNRAFSKSFFAFYAVLALGSLLFITPYVIKGIASSGMIAYPASIGYIASLPWAVSETMRQNEVCWIMSWARAPGISCTEVLASNAWMIDWFGMKTRYFGWYFKWYVYAFFLGVLFVLIVRFVYKQSLKGFAPIVLAMVIGVLYWFFAGPDPRFGMTYIVPLLAILFAYIVTHILRYTQYKLLFSIALLLSLAPLFMLGKNAFIIIWGIMFMLIAWQILQPKTLLWLFVISSIFGVANLYRHDKWGILEYPKVREVYVQKRVSDLGVLEYVRFDTPNDNTQAILYEARPMTPYFNQNLGKGEFLGREMFYTQEPKP